MIVAPQQPLRSTRQDSRQDATPVAPASNEDRLAAQPSPVAPMAHVNAGSPRPANVKLTFSGDVSDNLKTQIHRLQTSATKLSAAIDGVSGVVGGTGADLYADVNALNTLVGGSGSNTITVNTTAVDNALLTAPTGVISTDLATGRALMVSSPGATLQADIQTLSNTLNGTSSGSALQTVISTLISNTGGSGANAQAALNALSTLLFNNTNFASSLYTQASTLNANIDNGLSSLPAGGTYATVSTIASDGSGGVNFVISAGLGGGANGTYNLSAAAIVSGIGNGSSFTLSNGSNNIVLYNRSGATIGTQNQAISYLQSMYPSTSKLAFDISDEVTSGLRVQTGGSGSVRARIAAVDAAILAAPTGVLATDLATSRSALVSSPGANLQADMQAVNTLLNGTASGSTTQARIGTPTVNGSGTNLAAVIGGSGSDIASRLGDPVTASNGLSALTDGQAANNNNGIWNNVSNLQAATSLHDQVNAFLALFSTGSLANGSATTITFTVSGSAPTSLGSLVTQATSSA